MPRTIILICSVTTLISGCALFSPKPPEEWELAGGASYIPIEPFPVRTVWDASCMLTEPEKALNRVEAVHVTPLQSAMPDQTVRMAVAEIKGSISTGFGPATMGAEGESYQVVVDYAVSDVVAASFWVRRQVSGQIQSTGLFGTKYYWPQYKEGQTLEIGQITPATVLSSYTIYPKPTKRQAVQAESIPVIPENERSSFELITLPLYVGYGLRITATINVLKGEVAIGGLSQLAAEASAGTVTGSMVVQTLGMTGELVSTNLPLPNELDRSTAQNAILAIGSIKALLHDPDMKIYPRIIGLYNPYGGGTQFVNGVLSALADSTIYWARPCHYTYRKET